MNNDDENAFQDDSDFHILRKTIENLACAHKNISSIPDDDNGTLVCDDCGLMGDSKDDIRGEGSIEAAIEQESDERERKLNAFHATLASTPEALLAQIDEKMFRQIMNGYITVKLRPHDQAIGYYILSAQDRDLAFVPDPEEGCRFIAAIFLKAAHTIPKLRKFDEEAKGRELIHTNGVPRIVDLKEKQARDILTNGNGLKLIQ